MPSTLLGPSARGRDNLNFGHKPRIYIHAVRFSLRSEVEAPHPGDPRSGVLLEGLRQQRHAIRKRRVSRKGTGVDGQ